MKTICTSLILLFSVIHLYSQKSFEEGYFIDNSGTKTTCWIDNSDWNNNPVKFIYKLNPGSSEKIETIENVQEFSILGAVKYVRKNIDIDRINNSLYDLPSEPKPEFKKETLFLNLIVDGSTKLYQYIDGQVKIYFFQIEEGEITQLLKKDYLNDENKASSDFTYIRQLFTSLKCKDIPLDSYNEIRYRYKDFTNFFKKYNECTGSPYNVYKNNVFTDHFHLQIRPGFNLNSFDVDFAFNPFKGINLKNTPGFRVGIEAEFLLQRQKKKWAILTEASVFHMQTDLRSNGFQDFEFRYSSFNIGLGCRYYILPRQPKIRPYLSSMLQLNWPTQSGIDYENGNDITLTYSGSLHGSVGVLLFDKMMLEVSYHNNFISISDKFSSISAIVGYRIF